MRPDDVLRELTAMHRQAAEALKRLGDLRREDLTLGVTPKEAVYHEDKLTLYRYQPLTEGGTNTAGPSPVPLLIVYSLVNRPALVDMHETRSLVRRLLEHGQDVYLIDWGYPTRADRWLTMDDYITGYIDHCVDVVCQRHNLEAINVLGICQGGVFALCHAALFPEKIKNLVAMVTPVDFHVGDGVLRYWAGGACDPEPCVDVDRVVDAFGIIPGDLLNVGFVLREPFGLGTGKYLGMLELIENDARLLNFLRVEKWSFDSPDQTGEAFRQFVKDCYQHNRLVSGELMLGERRVDLRQITMPVLNLYAERDDLVPRESVEALGALVGSDDYTALSFPVGHIGMYISGKVQQALPEALAAWLAARA